jgi:hypothetical protein
VTFDFLHAHRGKNSRGRLASREWVLAIGVNRRRSQG